MRAFILNLMGFTCAFSFLLVLVFVFPGVLQGNFQVVHDFFEKYRGAEPFVIFIFPVIIVIGSAWVYKILYANSK